MAGLRDEWQPPMKAVHAVVGALAIGLSTGAAVYGGWCWWRAVSSSRWFWRLLRAGQAAVVVEAVLGGVLELVDHKAPGLHVLYGLLPLLVSLIAELLRVGAAQMVLDAQGFSSAAEVGTLPEDEQHEVVAAIINRELGVMALSAAINVVLLARAAGTA
jgi:hypothetical protein